MSKTTKAAREEALAQLKRLCRRGDILVAIQRGKRHHSGAVNVDFHIARRQRNGNLVIRGWVTWAVRVLMGYRDSKLGCVVPFMNMDPNFATADRLSHKLWPGSYRVSARRDKEPRKVGLGSEWL
jgi:hypothetical protein